MGRLTNTRFTGKEPQWNQLRELANAGFIVALNITWGGPEKLHSEFPKAWTSFYEERNYFVLDPVLYWTLTKSGQKRWSEIMLPDTAGIMRKAKSYGLHYGAVFSDRNKRSRSFMTAARTDREFADSELTIFEAIFQNFLSEFGNVK